MQANATSSVLNSTAVYNASEYAYDQQVLGPIGVGNSSEFITPLNDSALSSIISKLHPVAARRFGSLSIGQASENTINLSTENMSVSIDYGNLRNASTSKYFPAGARVRYALLQAGKVSIINASVNKAPPSACIYINLAASPICSNATTPAYIHVPVYHGHYGLTNQTWYPLNVSFKAHLIGNQTAPFNFSIVDLTNGTKLTPLTVISSNGLNVSENFKVNISDSVEITVGSGGNSNYSAQYTDPITTPAAIQYYVPITLTNGQTVGIPNPSQINVTVNSLAYQSYEASNLINVEFFYYNGTIVPSWLEGNVLNSAQKTNLYTSENNVYWLKIPGNFLPASSSNTLYMGFATTSNSLMDGITTGEAPWLSSTYGQYDDGSGVFYYYNAAPASTTGWTVHSTAGQTATAPAGSHFQTTNALYANSANGDYLYTSVLGLSTNEIISFDVYTTGLGNLFFLTNSAGSGQMARLDGRGGTDYSGAAAAASWTSWSAPASGLSEGKNIWYKYDIVIAGATANTFIGGNTLSIQSLGTFANSKAITNSGNYLGLVGDGLGSTYLTYWDGLLVRSYPPNGAVPTASFGSITATGSPSLTISTNPLIQGQSDVISATGSPNTDNVEILVNGGVVAGPASGTVTYNANVLSVGTYTVNALDTSDSKSVSQTLVVGYAPSLTLSSNSISRGASDTISATANPNTDNVELYLNGVSVAGPATGTVTYNANVLPPGTYFVKAVDTATGIYSTNTLLVSCAVPLSAPSGISHYACVAIVNSQSTPAPSPFQQSVTVNSLAYQSYEAGNLMNIEFFNYSGNVINSWLETANSNTATNTIYWLLITNSIAGNGLSQYSISANSELDVYMGFASTSTNLFNAYTTGEIATLSSTYSQYDNGGNVFAFYQNAPSNTTAWTIAGTAGLTSSAPSGSYMGTTNAFYANSANGDYMYTSLPGFTESNEIITYWTYTTDLGNLYFLDSAAGSGQMMRLGCGSGWYGLTSTTSWTSWTAPPDAATCNAWEKVDIVISGGSATGYYTPSSSATLGDYSANPSNIYTLSNNGNYIGYVGDAGGATYITYWSGLVVRAYPPSGVMPSTSMTPAASITLPNNCLFYTSNTVVDFGSIPTGTSITTQNSVVIFDQGTTPSNILIYGANWIGSTYPAYTFSVSNTVWSSISGTLWSIATKLLQNNAGVDTGIYVPAGGSNTIWLGAATPPYQYPQVYQQTIDIINSC